MHYMNKNPISTRTGTRGSIICTASNAGLYPFELEPMYAAAKHGVVGLVRSLEKRLTRCKIQVNGLAPCVVGMASLAPVTLRCR
jgi:NAD(P)-dependent dehydrogenase (short-subunit alcohol dehydrogenase family)